MNRRVHGKAVIMTADAVRMMVIQVTVSVMASCHAPAIAAARAVSSVRNRQMVPAALRFSQFPRSIACSKTAYT